MFSYHGEARKPLVHICCTYTVAELIPLPLIHPQRITSLVRSQKGFVRHSAVHQITGATCTERFCLVLLSSRSRLMGEKGVERSSHSGNCIPLSSPLHTCGACMKNVLERGELLCDCNPQPSPHPQGRPKGRVLFGFCFFGGVAYPQQLYIKHNFCNWYFFFLLLFLSSFIMDKLA